MAGRRSIGMKTATIKAGDVLVVTKYFERTEGPKTKCFPGQRLTVRKIENAEDGVAASFEEWPDTYEDKNMLMFDFSIFKDIFRVEEPASEMKFEEFMHIFNALTDIWSPASPRVSRTLYIPIDDVSYYRVTSDPMQNSVINLRTCLTGPNNTGAYHQINYGQNIPGRLARATLAYWSKVVKDVELIERCANVIQETVEEINGKAGENTQTA